MKVISYSPASTGTERKGNLAFELQTFSIILFLHIAPKASELRFPYLYLAVTTRPPFSGVWQCLPLCSQLQGPPRASSNALPRERLARLCVWHQQPWRMVDALCQRMTWWIVYIPSLWKSEYDLFEQVRAIQKWKDSEKRINRGHKKDHIVDSARGVQKREAKGRPPPVWCVVF